MWLTIAGLWLSIYTLSARIIGFFLHLVEIWSLVLGRRIDGAIAGLEPSQLVAVKKTEAREAAAGEPSLHKYDVFINHRGPDVKLTFAAHLTDALCRAGFFPFLDAKSIRQGHHVFKSIDEALSGACIHVAIFSKRYAESKYCLQELCDMLQSEKIIIPVFYDVKPEHLRYIEGGPYAKGFHKHRSRGRHKDIQKWKDALFQVSERRGFRKDEVKGDENELVKSIVVAVRRESHADLQPQRGHLFGLEESLEEALDTLTMMKKDVGVLGLVGMGGIGKTTLATEIYNHYVSRREFTHHSFLKDVRSTEQLHLQHQLVNDVIQEDSRSSTKKYRKWFDTFRTQKVLLVVDDIDNTSQFEGLIPDILGLASGSRIVVTSRHKDVLVTAVREAKCIKVFEVKLLNVMHSRQLFNWHAFYTEAPSRDFRDLAEKVADACGGHPLALEVIGASLFDKKDGPADREIWMDALRILNQNGDILDKLRISYNSLPSDGDRAMFRDIACLLIGMHTEVAMELWNSCRSCGDYCSTTKGPSLVLRRLMDKSLVKVDASNRLGMHDVIRDMGRDIVIKESSRPGKRTHLWNAATATRVLTKKEGTHRIRGIKLSTMESTGTPSYVVEHFASMDELHLLILDGSLLVGNEYSKLSQELRWVQWRSFPASQLPSGLNLPQLVVLDLTDSSSLSRLWQVDDLIQFPLLQRLILANCKGLQELPQNIGQSMPRLRTMEMEKCSLIAELPDSVGQLKCLEHLILSGCESLESLPEAVVNLTELKRLLLDDCSKLKQLPAGLGRLISMEVLNLSNCKCLVELPPSVNGLQVLKELHMKSTCKPDGRLLPFVGVLTALKAFHLCGNEAITVLPQSFGNLKSLVRLQISDCSTLVTVEALPRSLQHLDMAFCARLTNFPSIAEVNTLKSLNLCNCKSLTQIGGLECLTALEEINLAGCTSVLLNEMQVLHCRSLRTCYLTGSKVAVAYDNIWSEKEPAQQLISYYDDAIGYLPNGMTEKVLAREWSHEFLAETAISSEMECMAVIFCFVMHDQGWSDYPRDHGKYNSECYMDVWIMRENTRVYDSRLFTLRHADEHNQVYLCTFRRRHPFVQSLKLGDKICVCARSHFPGWKITVLEGAICVVHGEKDHRVIAMNSKLLNKDQSAKLVDKLSNLVVVDHCSSSLRPVMVH
ncbi:hypothetical protein M758_9G088700 [Ceratodon purpureus]|nr:hypothetical protein M758_9G088700 [Ceratodon purpureus]